MSTHLTSLYLRIPKPHTNLITGNIVIISVLAVAFFGYLQYQRNQGKTVKVGNKKLN